MTVFKLVLFLLVFMFFCPWLSLYLDEKITSHGFETTWGGVNNDRIFIFDWTKHFDRFAQEQKCDFICKTVKRTFLSLLSVMKLWNDHTDGPMGWQRTGTHTQACRLAGHCYSAVIGGLWVSEPPSTAVLFLSITWPICQQLTPPRWNSDGRRRGVTCWWTHTNTNSECGGGLLPERHALARRVLNIERLIFYVCHSISKKFLP